MANWGDILISEVKFNDSHTHISRVRYRQLNSNDKVSTVKGEFTRAEVVSEIKAGKKFSTITAQTSSDGNVTWSLGASIELFPMTFEFIKTKSDKSTKDNLDNLPEY